MYGNFINCILFYFSNIYHLPHQKSGFLKKVGVVVLAYGFGLILGNVGIFPERSEEFRDILKDKTALSADEVTLLFNEGVINADDVLANQIANIQQTIISIVILLAIPLLLFSLDFKSGLS